MCLRPISLPLSDSVSSATQVLPAPKAPVRIGANPDVKALGELLPSGVIIIIICKTRGLDQLIFMGSSPAEAEDFSFSRLGVHADRGG